jgi:serine/threonine protein kinase
VRHGSPRPALLHYESLTGRPPFQGTSSIGILHAITELPVPPIREVRPDVPPLAEHILTRALEKDCELCYQHAADLRTDLQRLMRDSSRSAWDASSPGQEQRDRGEPQPVVPALAPRPRPRKAYYAAAAALVLAIAGGAFLLHHAPPGHLPDSREWEHLTLFTDSAVYPDLSSDGRMLAFIRGDGSFMGPGQIYVKLLPWWRTGPAHPRLEIQAGPVVLSG